MSKFKENRLWWEGPIFLRSEKDWPIFEGANKTPNFIDSDDSTTVLVSANVHAPDINALLPCENYSCFDKLIRITSLVLKFVKLLFRKISEETHKELLFSDLYDEATTLWYKEAQKSFIDDTQFPATKSNLGVFSNSKGALRAKGRIDNASLPYETKFPVLLPWKHRVTLLIALKCHKIVKHN